MARKFGRHINRDELEALCAKHNWPLDTSKYDAGSDWVTFQWQHAAGDVRVVYCPFNGRFIVHSGQYYSERSEDGCTPWFDALIDVLYRDEKVAT